MRLHRRTGLFCLLLTLAGPLRAQVDSLKRDSTRHGTLQEIKILGQRPLVEKKLDRTVVHVDALLANTGGHAWDALENAPGVVVDDDGTISLNGKSGVLVLIDDRPTYLSSEQLMNYLKGLPAAQLEQIELLPTPPARYPANGGAGIIIFRTKKANQDGLEGQLSSTYAQGVYPKTTQSISLMGQYGPWQFNVLGSYSYTNSWNNSYRYRDYFNSNGTPDGNVTQAFQEESWTHEFDYNAGLEHKGKSMSWGALFNGSANPYRETGHYGDGYYGVGGETDSLDQILSHFSQRTSDLSANAHALQKLSSKGGTLSADADYIHYEQHPLQSEYTTTTIPGDTATPQLDLTTQQPFTANIFSLKTDYTNSFGSHTFFESGFQSTWSLRKNLGTYLEGPPADLVPDDSLDDAFTYDERILSAYVSLRHEGGRLSLQGGLRLENTDGKGVSTGSLDSSFHLRYTNLFPSVHALWSVDTDKRNQIGFSYSRRIDRPDYSELNPTRFFFDPNTYFSGNPALQPQFSNNFEGSYTYLDRYTLTASYSLNHGSIAAVYFADGPEFYYYSVNFREETTTGLSLDVSTPISSHWTWNTEVEWMYKHYQSVLPGNVSYDKTLPNLTLSGSTRYAFNRGWSAEISGFYRSATLYGETVWRPTGRLNGAIRKKFWKNKASLTLAGNDVLRTGITGRFIYLNGVLAHITNSGDRRQVLLTFAYSFGKKLENVESHTSGAASEKARL
jgi:iron complex outermembrane recepter protein